MCLISSAKKRVSGEAKAITRVNKCDSLMLLLNEDALYIRIGKEKSEAPYR